MSIQIGDRFEMLTVVAPSQPTNNRIKQWECKCDCGTIKVVQEGNLKHGQVKSCGCLRKQRSAEVARNNFTSHGEGSGGKTTTEYRTWVSMIQRCYQPTHDSYKHYGGRGITVCDEFRNSYPRFLEEIGRRPSIKHSLDRIDNSRGYEVGNIRWATREEQQNNRRDNRLLEFCGDSLSIAQISRRVGVPPDTLRQRINNGRSLKEAIVLEVEVGRDSSS